MDEDLLINIEVDSGNAARGLSILNKNVIKTDKQTAKLQEAISDLEKNLKGAAVVATQMGKAAEKMGVKTTKQMKEVEKEANLLSRTMENLGKAAESTSNKIITIGDAFSKTVSIVNTYISAVRLVARALDDLTNPAFIQRLSKLSKLLAFILLAKGYGNLYRILMQTAKALDIFASKLRKIRSFAFQNLTEDAIAAKIAIAALPKPIGAVIVAIGALDRAVDTIAGGLGTFFKGIAAVNRTFQTISISINNFSNTLKLLTDPNKIARLANLLKILSMLFKLRGDFAVAEGLRRASDEVTRLGLFVNKFNKESENNFQALAEKVEMVENVLNSLKVTIIGLGATAATVFTAGLAKGTSAAFSSVAKDMNLSSKTIERGLKGSTDALKVLTSTILGLGRSAASTGKIFTQSFVGSIIASIVQARNLKGAFASAAEEFANFGTITRRDIPFASLVQENLLGKILPALNKLSKPFNAVDDSLVSMQKSLAVTTDVGKIFAGGLANIGNAFNQIIGPLRFGFGVFSTQVAGLAPAINSLALVLTDLTLVAHGLPPVFGVISVGYGAFNDQVRASFKLLKDFTVFMGGQVVQSFKNFGDVVIQASAASVKALNSAGQSLIALGEVAGRAGKEFRTGFVSGVRDATGAARTFSQRTLTAGSVMRNSLSPSIIGATEAGVVLAPVLFALGKAASESTNDFVRFGGILTSVLAVALAGFSAVVTATVATIGDLIAKVGGELIDVMTRWEKVAAKASAVTFRFNFVLKGFARTMGEEVVGSADMWNEMIGKVVANSTFLETSLQKSTKLLIAEGQALGLSVADNTAILERAADVAAATGIAVEDVTLRIVKALGGNAESLKALGIFVDDAALKHSKYAQELGKSVASMDMYEKAQVRLNEIFKQTVPLVGAAAAELETIEGANRKYEAAVLDLQAALGQQGAFTIAYTNALTKLLTALTRLPPTIKDAVGMSVDFLGVSLKLIGTLIKYSITLATLVTVFQILNGIIASNIIVQKSLTVSFAFVASSVGANTIAVTSLNAAWINLVAIVKGSVLIVFKTLGQVLLSLAAKIAVVTKVVLASPLFYKSIVIVTAVFATIEAIKQLRQELTQLQPGINKNAETANVMSKAWKQVGDIVKGITKVIVDFTKVVILGLLKLVRILQLGVKGWGLLGSRILGASKAAKEFEKEGALIIEQIIEVEKAGDISLASLKASFGGVAFAAEGAKDKISAMKDTLEEVAFVGRGFSNSLRLSGEALDKINIDVFGDKFEKAKEQVQSAADALNNLRNIGIIKVGTEFIMPTTENLEKLRAGALDKDGDKAVLVEAGQEQIQKALIELETRRAQALRTRRDEMASIAELGERLNIEAMERGGQELMALQKKNAAELEAFRSKVKAMEKLGKLTDAERAKIAATEKAIISRGKATELALMQSLDEKKIKPFEDQLKVITDQTRKFNEASAMVGKTQIEGIRQLEKMRLDEIALLEEQLEKEGLLTKERKARLEAGRAAVTGQAEADIQAQTGGAPEGLINAMQGFQGGITAAAGPLMGAIGAANMIADAVQGVIDAVPQLLTKIANIFTSLTELPMKIVEGMMNLTDAIGGFIRDFIPNLLTGIVDLFEEIFVELPEVISKSIFDLFLKLPEVVEGLVDRLPEIAQRLAFGFVANTPRIVIAFINFFIRGLPRIQMALIKAMPEIAAAFVVGIIDGVKEVFGLIGDLFAGTLKPFDEEDVKKIGKAVTDVSSQLFQVIDMQAAARGISKAKEIDNIINRALDRLKDIFAGLMQALLRVWEWIRDKILMPVFNALKSIWEWVYNKVLMPMVDGLKAVWNFVLYDVIQPLLSGLKAVFDFVVNKVVLPLVDGLKAVFNFVIDKVIKPFNNIVLSLANVGVELHRAIFSVFTGIFDAIKALFNGDISGFTSKIQEAFVNAGSKIADAIKKPINQLIDVINGLKIGPVDWKIDAGRLGKASGNLIPQVDLVPGNIQKFQDGGPVLGFGTGDSVPAMMQPGEFVINRNAASALGASFLSNLNKGMAPGSNTFNFDVKMNIETNEKMDEGFVRTRLVPTIKKELKQASLKGEFLLSQKGIRAT